MTNNHEVSTRKEFCIFYPICKIGNVYQYLHYIFPSAANYLVLARLHVSRHIKYLMTVLRIPHHISRYNIITNRSGTLFRGLRFSDTHCKALHGHLYHARCGLCVLMFWLLRNSKHFASFACTLGVTGAQNFSLRSITLCSLPTIALK